MKIRSPVILWCPPRAVSTRELGQRQDKNPASLPECRAGILCPRNQSSASSSATPGTRTEQASVTLCQAK